jgi:hypothetical protein
MSPTCRAFRLLLERRLAGRPMRERLTDLAWHEHLFACADCRAVLEDEEALESLLASLPEPRLAPAVRQRVLARLRFAREEEWLDRMLDRAASDAPPANLAFGVLAGLARRRAEERLDRLLDLDQVEVPAGLAGRTLASLRLARRPRRVALRIVAALAAAAALTAIAWITWPRRAETGRSSLELAQGADAAVRPVTPVTPAADAPVDDDVLEAFDVLENWDVLVSDDVETLLGTLPADEAATLEGFEEEG